MKRGLHLKMRRDDQCVVLFKGRLLTEPVSAFSTLTPVYIVNSSDFGL